MHTLIEAIVEKYSRRLGCREDEASVAGILTGMARGSACSLALAAVAVAHPAALGVAECMDCALIAGYNALWLAASLPGLGPGARRAVTALRKRLRVYLYERSTDYASTGYRLVVVEGKKGYPVYFRMLCPNCFFEKREDDNYTIYYTGVEEFSLRQVVPKTLSPEFFREIGFYRLVGLEPTGRGRA